MHESDQTSRKTRSKEDHDDGRKTMLSTWGNIVRSHGAERVTFLHAGGTILAVK